MMLDLKAKDLEIGDRIFLSEFMEFGWAIVTGIDEKKVYVERPYMQLGEHEYSVWVPVQKIENRKRYRISYIGIEHMELLLVSNSTYQVSRGHI